LRECLIDESGMVKVEERMEGWCRVIGEKFVVDEGMERMVENGRGWEWYRMRGLRECLDERWGW
jgi:hypothetical protein